MTRGAVNALPSGVVGSIPTPPTINCRVGRGGLCPPMPERGKEWKPFQGFHNRGLALLREINREVLPS